MFLFIYCLKNSTKSGLTFIFFIVCLIRVPAQIKSIMLSKPGTKLHENNTTVLPENSKIFSVDLNALQLIKKSFSGINPLQKQSVHVTIPLPEGGNFTLKLEPSATMEPLLAEKFTQIKTYRCYGITNKAVYGSLTINQYGVDIFLSGPGFELYMLPNGISDKTSHRVFRGKDAPFHNSVICENADTPLFKIPPNTGNCFAKISAGNYIKNYRLAIVNTAASADFSCYRTVTPYNFDNASNFITAVTAHLAKVNVNYERDMGIHFKLVNNNEQLFLADEINSSLGSGTYPFSGSLGGSSIFNVHKFITDVIGTANFDIGHCLEGSCNGAGVAFVSGVCNSANKGKGKSAYPSVNTFCHEIGHQFSAPHSWNAISCGSQWSSLSAVEPGAGITWMSYKNRCALSDQVAHQEDDNNAIQFAHVKSYEFIQNFSNSVLGNCALINPVNNNAPVVTVPDGGFYIPIQTPFQLAGSAVDSDNDALTYAWQQTDIGIKGAMNNPTGNAPVFTTFNPVTNSVRIFPQLSDILNNTTTPGELLPSYPRDLTFRLFVRDNAGGSSYNETAFKVAGNSGPFKVCSQQQNISYSAGSTMLISWTVANTNAYPVNCAFVKITLSTDGGFTFPYILNNNTPNDGYQSVTLPLVVSGMARIKVEAVGNIFFSINQSDFTIVSNLSTLPCDSSVCFYDRDADGFGSNNYIRFCGETPPPGFVLNSLDCNDSSATINPDKSELCNGKDDNCNGIIDDIDEDNDGYYGCADDCNDHNAAINPAMQEIADDTDNNCNGLIDEDAALSFDGTDCVNLTHVARPQNMTLSFRIKTNNISYWKKIINWHGTNNNHNIEVSLSQGALAYAEDDGSWQGNYISENIADGMWHHVVLTRDSTGKYTAYIDGVITAVNRYLKTPVTNVLSLGGVDNYGEFIGTIDELKLWNSTISAAGVLAEFNCMGPALNTNLLLYYDFNEGIPLANNSMIKKLYDHSGNNGSGSFISFNLFGNSSNYTPGRLLPKWYKDNDGDGFGNPLIFKFACPAPPGFVSNATDCNDNDFFIHPSQGEKCFNNKDDNCNSQVDESCILITGEITNTVCTGPATGAVSLAVTGGRPPYTFSWSNGTTAKNISNLITGVYTVSVKDVNNIVFTKSFTVANTSPLIIPPTPGLITGATDICNNVYNNLPQLYSIRKVNNTNGYRWFITDSIHARIAEHYATGANDTIVLVELDSGFTTGQMAVEAVNNCGVSNTKYLTITKKPPSIPVISGNPFPCAGYTEIYTAASVTGTTYTWTISSTVASILSGQGTATVTLLFKPGFIRGLISVKAQSVCGISSNRSMIVEKCTGNNLLAKDFRNTRLLTKGLK